MINRQSLHQGAFYAHSVTAGIRRGLSRREGQALIVIVLIVIVLVGVVAGSVLTWVRPEESRATQVSTQVAILVAAAGSIIALTKLMPSRQTWPVGNAVGELRDGAAVVGRVVRVGSRHLICPSGPACAVLGTSDADAQEVVSGRHLSVYFPAGTSGGGGVEAKVVAWGPALRRLGRPKVAVLRTGRRLPRSIPRLSLARHPHRGRAYVLLPAPGAASSAAAGPAGDLDGTELTVSQALPPGAAGAPVLVGGPDPNSGHVVALLAADAGGSGAAPPPGTGRSVPVVAADDAQALLDWLTRRQALRLGAVSLASVTVGVGVTRWPTGAASRRITGVGWSGLFEAPHVQDGLGAELRAAGLEASTFTFDVAQKSGVESLTMLTPQWLSTHDYDFVTCPNDTVRDSLEVNIRKAGMTSERYEFCHGSMVLLVRRRAVPALQQAGLLFLEQGRSGEEVLFDVQTYFRSYDPSRTWKMADPNFDGRYSGNPIKIGFSDPCSAGGGELFLATLRQAQTDLQNSGQLRGLRRQETWLWGEDGPLHASGYPTTKSLLPAILDSGAEEMAFVYEHDAIRALLGQPKRAENFVLLRTSPEAPFTQYLLSLSPVGEVVGKALGESLADTLFQQLRVRANGMDGKVNDLLAGEVLAKTRCPVGRVGRHNTVGRRAVTFQNSDLQRLVNRMPTSAPSAP